MFRYTPDKSLAPRERTRQGIEFQNRMAIWGYVHGFLRGEIDWEVYDALCCNFMALLCYRTGFRWGLNKRRAKIKSGEWVLYRGVYGPPPKMDTSVLALIEEYRSERYLHEQEAA